VDEPLTVAFGALACEMLEDLNDRLDAQPKAEPLSYGVLADLLAARIEPRIAAMEQRLAGLAADMGMLKVRMRAPRRKIP
jgi:hypothetical protein